MAKIIKKIMPSGFLELVFLLNFFGSSALVCAQNSENQALEEVVVTAQMRAENIQSVPLAIGAYDKDFIRQVGASSLTEMEAAIPNMNFGRGDRNTRGEIAIRGIGDYARNIGTNARVAVYIDGVLTGRSSSFDQSLLDVARIEVLRGPQGTLAGTNALAGAINIVTEKPSEEFDAELRSDIGDFNLQSLTGKINLPITDELFASLLLASTEQDGYIHNLTLDRDLQGVKREVAKLKFRYLGVEHLQLNIGFDYLSDDDQSTNGEALANAGLNGFSLAPDPMVVAHNADEFEQRELKGATIEAMYDTPASFRWTSITGVRANEFTELSEEDYSPFDVAFSVFDEQSDQLSQEFRLASPRGGRADYVVGIYLLDQDSSTRRSATAGPLFAPAPNAFIQTPATAELQSQSVYAHGNYYLDSRWSVTAGVRYVHEAKNIDYTSNDNSGLFINVDHIKDEQTFNEWLPKAGINFQLTPDTLLYSSVARGYKSGGWNADFITTMEYFQFDPEYATNYEMGVKTSFLDKKLIFNALGFVTKVDDFQVFQFVPSQASGTVLSLTNAGKVTSQGIELDVTAGLTEHLSLGLNAAFTQAKFDRFQDGGGPGVNYDDNYLPYAPERAYFVAVDYRRPIFQQMEAYAHIDYGYTGDYFSNPNNTPDNAIQNYFASNVRIGFNVDSAWDIAVWVKNITDETNLRQRSVSFIGVPRGFYNPPRTYGVAINYSFQ